MRASRKMPHLLSSHSLFIRNIFGKLELPEKCLNYYTLTACLLKIFGKRKLRENVLFIIQSQRVYPEYWETRASGENAPFIIESQPVYSEYSGNESFRKNASFSIRSQPVYSEYSANKSLRKNNFSQYLNINRFEDFVLQQSSVFITTSAYSFVIKCPSKQSLFNLG